MDHQPFVDAEPHLNSVWFHLGRHLEKDSVNTDNLKGQEWDVATLGAKMNGFPSALARVVEIWRLPVSDPSL